MDVQPQAVTDMLALEKLQPDGGSRDIELVSPAFGHREPIPERYAAYGDGLSPELQWDDVPAGTQSLAVVMEDPDAPGSSPFVHWLIFNIPASLRGLPEAVAAGSEVAELGGARQGRNAAGSIGYFGPQPPKSHPPHHYHFQVFALDTQLELKGGIERTALLDAMKGHVLAEGDLVGIYRAPQT